MYPAVLPQVGKLAIHNFGGLGLGDCIYPSFFCWLMLVVVGFFNFWDDCLNHICYLHDKISGYSAFVDQK